MYHLLGRNRHHPEHLVKGKVREGVELGLGYVRARVGSRVRARVRACARVRVRARVGHGLGLGLGLGLGRTFLTDAILTWSNI